MKTFARSPAAMPVKHKPAPVTAEHAPLRLEHFLPYRLSILSNTVSQAIASDYQRRYDISMTEWRVMAVLARFEGLSAREVAVGHRARFVDLLRYRQAERRRHLALQRTRA